MSLDADFIVDRRRMRRKLTFWRVFAVLFAICAVVAAGMAVRSQGSGVLACVAYRVDDRGRVFAVRQIKADDVPGARRGVFLSEGLLVRI